MIYCFLSENGIPLHEVEMVLTSNERNDELSVKLPLMKTEFGRKGLYFLAAKEFNNLPLQARKIESRLLFRQFLDKHFNDI